MSTIFIVGATKQIIDKYEFHPEIQTTDKVLPDQSNQKMNANLKEVANICGTNKPISIHTARYKFAKTVALGNTMPLEVVYKMLGNSSNKMTQRYVRTTENLIIRNMKNIMEKY